MVAKVTRTVVSVRVAFGSVENSLTAPDPSELHRCVSLR